jgi:hypothetical protein
VRQQKVPAEEGTRQGEKRLVYVSPLFIANAQPPELIQPSEGPLDYPALSAQPAAMFGVALGKKRDDVAGTQTSPDCLCVITTIA